MAPESYPEADWQQEADQLDQFADDEGMAGAWLAIVAFTFGYTALCIAAGFALAGWLAA